MARRRRDRERSLVQATRALFDERGMQDAPIEEIAKAVGIARGLIYRQFSSKEELYVLTVTDYLDELAAVLEEAFDAEAQPDRLGDHLVQVARRPSHQRHRAVQERGVAVAERGVGLQAAGRALDRVVGALARRPGEVALELRQVVGHRQDVELLLGGELAVDEAAGDPDGARDVLDGRVLHPVLVEQRACRGDQLALADLTGGSGHGGESTRRVRCTRTFV